MVEDKQENPFEGAMSQLIKFISAKDGQSKT